MAPAKEQTLKVTQKETSQQHHQKAADHYKCASEYHKEAVRHCECGDHNAAAHNSKAEAYHARIANEHAVQATKQETEDSKCADMHSLKTI